MDYSSLIQELKKTPVLDTPVILPDFFLDHFVIAGEFNEFIQGLKELAEQGGGNLLGNTQLVRRGGNSVNTACALKALDANPCIIITTDEQGLALMKGLAPELDFSYVHLEGNLSATVSIEVTYDGRRVNLMISDSGSASDFGFNDLTKSDLELIKQSGLVSLLNLNHNRRAVELSSELFSFVKSETSAITFTDIGDPSNNPEIIEPLAKKVVSEGLVDYLGVNENEAAWFAWALDGRNGKWREALKDPTKWLSAARYLAKETGVSVQLHTQYYTGVVETDDVLCVPTFDVPSDLLCGAGDAWNAGAIYGILSDFTKHERLVLSNAISALYVSSKDATHPTKSQIIEFLESNPLLSEEGKKLLKPEC